VSKKQKSKMSEAEREERDFRKRFPDAHARKRADEAMDAIAVTEPMTTFLDAWIRAYIVAGGKTPLKLD